MIMQWLIQWTAILYAGSLFLSQSLMDFFATLLLIVLFWMGFRWKEQLSQKTLFTSIGLGNFLLPIWIIVTFISFATSGFIVSDWYIELLNYKWIILFLVLVTAIKYIEPNEKAILPTSIFLSLTAIYAVVLWFLGFDPITNMPLASTAAGMMATGGFLTNHEIAALMQGALLPVLSGLFLSHFKWREKAMWILLLATLCTIVSFILTMKADVWLTTFVALTMMSFIMSRRLGFLVFVGELLLASGLNFIWPDFHHAVSFAVHSRFDLLRSIFHQNFDIVRDNLLFGLGLGHNATYLGQYDYYLVCTGVVGLLVFIVIQLYFFSLNIQIWHRVSSRNVFHQGLTLGLLGAQLSIMLSNIFNQNMQHPMMLGFIALIWALVVWLAYEYRVLREHV